MYQHIYVHVFPVIKDKLSRNIKICNNNRIKMYTWDMYV